MKLAIHPTQKTFSERWVAYCEEIGVPTKVVNCYATNIIEQLDGCAALMWHHNHTNYKDVLFAKQLLFAVGQSGKTTFPDYRTCWHFDDKVGQKYLLEGIGAPLVPSYVFYSPEDAFRWIDEASFPKVFKLRGGAGSANVRLVHTAWEARKLVRKAFGSGFQQFDRVGHARERLRKYREGKDTLTGVLKGFGRLFVATEFAKMHGAERGYVYFQDYLPDNTHDIRVIVIEDKAFAIKRMVRPNDFRASGSGNILYEKEHFRDSTIELAFELHRKLQSQCSAFDFVEDRNGTPKLLEVSYGFISAVYLPCVGYWDRSLEFHPGPFHPQDWMVDAVLRQLG